MERYNIKNVEEKWQNIWSSKKTDSVIIDKNKKKFYCLEMFPSPSGKYIWDMLEIILLETS